MKFDRLAPHYDWLEALTAGDKLQRARTAWLEELSKARRMLSAGEGHGRFAAACRARFPEADLTCVEASPRMLARAKQRVGPVGSRTQWVCADVLSWTPPEEKFDAVVTCFFLDCFPPETLAAVVAKLAACTVPGAVWLVTDFALPPDGPSRRRAQLIHALMYALFRLAVDLPARRLTPPDDLLRAHGFHLVGRRESEWGLLRSELWRRS